MDDVPPCKKEYARAFIEYLKGDRYRDVHGRLLTWVAYKRDLYPEFLSLTRREYLPWRSVCIEFAKLTDKRPKEFRFYDDRGELVRKPIPMYRVPQPKM